MLAQPIHGFATQTPQPCKPDFFFCQEVDPSPDTEDLESLEEGAGSFLTDLAGSIPGIDEAMSFAEVMRQVNKLVVAAACFMSSR